MKVGPLFYEKLEARVQATKDLTVGLEQKVTLVETDRGRYVLKEPFQDREINAREKLATDLCARVGVPAPKVHWWDSQALIQDYLEGTPMDRAPLEPEERRHLFCQLGEILGRLHTINLPGFGRLQCCGEEGRGSHQTYLEFYRSQPHVQLPDHGFPKGRARDYFEANRHFLEREAGVLVHFDMEEEHVLIRDKQIVGLVDFASAFVGSPAEEFTRMYGLRWQDPNFQALLEGYPPIDPEEISFFTFLHLHWRIPWNLRRGHRPERIKLLTGLYRRLIGGPSGSGGARNRTRHKNIPQKT